MLKYILLDIAISDKIVCVPFREIVARQTAVNYPTCQNISMRIPLCAMYF